MLTLPPSVRIYAAVAPVDLRKSFDGLSLLVEQQLRLDPRSGHLFVAFNRRGDQVPRKRLGFSRCDRNGRFVWARPEAHQNNPGLRHRFAEFNHQIRSNLQMLGFLRRESKIRENVSA